MNILTHLLQSMHLSSYLILINLTHISSMTPMSLNFFVAGTSNVKILISSIHKHIHVFLIIAHQKPKISSNFSKDISIKIERNFNRNSRSYFDNMIKQKNTPATLNQFICDTFDMNVNIYTVKPGIFPTISSAISCERQGDVNLRRKGDKTHLQPL